MNLSRFLHKHDPLHMKGCALKIFRQIEQYDFGISIA